MYFYKLRSVVVERGDVSPRLPCLREDPISIWTEVWSNRTYRAKVVISQTPNVRASWIEVQWNRVLNYSKDLASYENKESNLNLYRPTYILLVIFCRNIAYELIWMHMEMIKHFRFIFYAEVKFYFSKIYLWFFQELLFAYFSCSNLV